MGVLRSKYVPESSKYFSSSINILGYNSFSFPRQLNLSQQKFIGTQLVLLFLKLLCFQFSARATVMNIFRVPLNLIVIILLVQVCICMRRRRLSVLDNSQLLLTAKVSQLFPSSSAQPTLHNDWQVSHCFEQVQATSLVKTEALLPVQNKTLLAPHIPIQFIQRCTPAGLRTSRTIGLVSTGKMILHLNCY